MSQSNTTKRNATICFLYHGNGESILKSLLEILPRKDGWSFLVVNKKSSHIDTSCKKIEQLSFDHPELDYVLLKEKAEYYLEASDYAKFVIASLDFCKTEFICFVDEGSSPFLENIDQVLQVIKKEKIAAARGNASKNNGRGEFDSDPISNDRLFVPGAGILDFGLKGMSLNGMIYNVSLLKNRKILQRFHENLKAHRDYPHFHLNILASANLPTYLSKLEFYSNKMRVEKSGPYETYFSVHSYGKRCDQLIAIRNLLFEAFLDAQKLKSGSVFDMVGFYSAYTQLCLKYFKVMVTENVDVYLNQMMSIEMLVKSFNVFAVSSIDQFPDYKFFKDSVQSQIKNAGNNLIDDFKTKNIKPPAVGFQNDSYCFFSN